MSLFFVHHQHTPDTCPAGDPAMGAQLLIHLSPANAGQYGIHLQGEAVLDGQHTLVLILEADDRSQVEKFMQPFGQAGPVTIHAASECETVVGRAGC